MVQQKNMATMSVHKIPTKLLDLNTDCLEKIANNLTILEQTNLSQVCKGWQHVLQTIWQRRYKNHTIDGFHSNYQTQTHFRQIYVQLKNFIVTLRIEHLESRIFRQVETLKFVNCLQLAVHDWYHDYTDEDMRRLTHMFVNLQVLSVQAPCISGAHLEHFERLQQLDVSHCARLSTDCLPRIFGSLPLQRFKLRCNNYSPLDAQLEQHWSSVYRCRTLQHLELDDQQLAMLLTNRRLQQLPHLRSVKCYVRDYLPHLLADLQRYYASQITQLTALEDNIALPVLRSIASDVYTQLQKLTIVDSCLLQLPLCRAPLRELHLIGCNLQQSLLLSWLREQRSLKLLNVARSKGLQSCFVWQLIEMLCEQDVTTNSVPLRLLFEGSSLSANLVYHPVIIQNKNVLQLSLDVFPFDYEINHFEFVLKN